MTRIPFLAPRYSGSHGPGRLHVNPAWAYVPPVRPQFRLNLDREESTSRPGVCVAEADRRRREDFPIQDEQRYPSKLIEEALKAKIAENIGIAAEEIVVGNGLMSLMTYVYSVFAEPGDRVVVPTPGFWPAYTYALQRGIGISMPQFRLIDEEANPRTFEFPLEDTLSALDGARICYLCNPSNPTGTYLEPELIRTLVGAAPDVVFIIDNAYGHFCARMLSSGPSTPPAYFLDDSFELLLDGAKNILIGNTFSKAYGLANHRIGFFCGHRDLIATLAAHMGPYDLSEINLSLAYYNYVEDAFVSALVNTVVRNKQIFEEQLERSGVTHYGGYRNSVLVEGLDLGEAYESSSIAVRSMVYQEGIPNPIGQTFRIAIPSEQDGFDFLAEMTDKITQ